jgi:DMSO/TMAO reductase YedYZ molybdopterin-dependent catalytic subunit
VTLPEKVRVCGVDYAVKQVKHPMLDGMEKVGVCDWHIAEIEIKQELDEQVKMSTLLHELVHLIAEMNEQELDEELVCILSTGLYQIMADNPGLFA